MLTELWEYGGVYGCLVWFATKKSPGISFRDALHGHFFGQQEKVDEHIFLNPSEVHKGAKDLCNMALNVTRKYGYTELVMKSCRCAAISLLEMPLGHQASIMPLMKQLSLGLLGHTNFLHCL